MSETKIKLSQKQELHMKKLAQLRRLSKECNALRTTWEETCTHPPQCVEHDKDVGHDFCDLCMKYTDGYERSWDYF